MSGALDLRACSAVVGIPAKDEAERIGDCLTALSQQARGQDSPVGVVLLVNNTSDRTMRVVEEVRADLVCPVLAIEHRFPPEQATAGQARRLAMAYADQLAPEGVPLLTTDADGCVAPDWLAANLHHLRHGLDAVFGRAEIDLEEAAHIPPSLRLADAEECAFAAVLDEIESLLDPDGDDLWPRHTEHSGASIAVARAMFRTVGGVPPVSLGEDRAFYAALRRADARIRHAPEVRVKVSGRILGRAPGGMADTIRRRLVAPDTVLDDALEPVAARVRRINLRRAARAAFHADRRRSMVAGEMHARSFGETWAAVDQRLKREPVVVASLPREMARALAVRDKLVTERAMLAEVG